MRFHSYTSEHSFKWNFSISLVISGAVFHTVLACHQRQNVAKYDLDTVTLFPSIKLYLHINNSLMSVQIQEMHRSVHV